MSDKNTPEKTASDTTVAPESKDNGQAVVLSPLVGWQAICANNLATGRLLTLVTEATEKAKSELPVEVKAKVASLESAIALEESAFLVEMGKVVASGDASKVLALATAHAEKLSPMRQVITDASMLYCHKVFADVVLTGLEVKASYANGTPSPSKKSEMANGVFRVDKQNVVRYYVFDKDGGMQGYDPEKKPVPELKFTADVAKRLAPSTTKLQTLHVYCYGRQDKLPDNVRNAKLADRVKVLTADNYTYPWDATDGNKAVTKLEKDSESWLKA
jgi:hypothetical protein